MSTVSNVAPQHLTSLSQLTQDRALEFLGLGYSQERVAQVIGVTPSAVSQLMANEDFREAVRERRTEQLRQQTELDRRYDTLEGKLLKKLEQAVPLMAIGKTRDILDAIKVVNGAKRRGAEVAPTTEAAKTVVLNMPVQILQHFTSAEVQKLPNNQIVKAGSQDLLTLTPQALTNHARETDPPPASDTASLTKGTFELSASDLD